MQYDRPVSDTATRADFKAKSDKARRTIMYKGLYLERTACVNANIASGKEKFTELFGEIFPKLRELKKCKPKSVIKRSTLLPRRRKNVWTGFGANGTSSIHSLR